MIKKILNRDYTRFIGFSLQVFLVVIVLPLLWISFYNFPFSDDLTLGSKAHEVFASGGNIFQIIGAGVGRAYEMYFTWQGSYGTCFFCAINPSIIGENYYFIGTFVILLSFVLCELLFLGKIFELFLFEKNEIRIIRTLIVIMQLLFVPGIVESFYWFSGAVYYTFFFGIFMLLISLMIDRSRDVKELNVRTVSRNIMLVFLVVLMGGGNYPVGLMLSLMALVYIFYSIIKLSRGSVFQILLSLLYLVCFATNVLSPGNQVRQTLAEKMGVFESIFHSFRYAYVYGSSWVHIYIIVGFLFLTPFIWKGLKRSQFRFPLPGVILILSICMFSAYFTPTLYATSSPGPRRLICIIYYLFYILLLINYSYILGWMQKKNFKILNHFNNKPMMIRNLFYVVCAVIFLLSLGITGIKNTNPVKAFIEIKSGQAEAFRQENLDRLKQLKDPENNVVILEDFIAKPSTIFLTDLEDVNNYMNKALADYYHKKEVILRSYLKKE